MTSSRLRGTVAQEPYSSAVAWHRVCAETLFTGRCLATPLRHPTKGWHVTIYIVHVLLVAYLTCSSNLCLLPMSWLNLDDRGSMTLRNVAQLLPDYTTIPEDDILNTDLFNCSKQLPFASKCKQTWKAEQYFGQNVVPACNYTANRTQHQTNIGYSFERKNKERQRNGSTLRR
jgi:hypothetical protein